MEDVRKEEESVMEVDKIITNAPERQNEETTTTIPEKVFKTYSVTGEELLNMKIEELPYLVKNLLPRTGAVALAGSSDAGKSSFLRQLACSIAYQEAEFLGFEITAKHHSVIYVSTEDDRHAVAYLLNKQKMDDREPADLKGLRFIFESDNLTHKLDKELDNQPADCVIIDTFTDIYSGELNASNKVRSFINDFVNLSKKHNCLFIFLHHTGKRTEMYPPSKDNLLGSQGFEAKMRLVMELRKDYADTAKRHLCIVKGNYIREKDKEESYVLAFDERLRYTKLSDRVALHLLAKPDPKQDDTSDAQAKAIELKKKGLSVTKIKDEMKKQGISVGRSTIGNWVKGYPSVQPSLVEQVDGQPNIG